MRCLAATIIALWTLWPYSALSQLLEPSATSSDERGPLVDVANPLVEIRSFFSGAEIFVFGALSCEEDPCDVIVIVEGPPTEMIVRRKEQMAGIWLNGRSQRYAAAPGYYAIASTRPVADLLPAETLRQRGLGIPNLFLTPVSSGETSPQANEAAMFRNGLTTVLIDQNLYQNAARSVVTKQGRLFRTTFKAPAAVPTGSYHIAVLTVRSGHITGYASQQLLIQKAGFEAFVSSATRTSPLTYALVSVFLTLSIGFISATLFSRR